jgi:dTDP-glucose 4,6-dehydratase
MAIIVTGGAGFTGSNFIINSRKESEETLIYFDALTYAGNYSKYRTFELVQ